jgi:hypothetical protein
MGRYKTEANKGVKEYSPKKTYTVPNNLSTEEQIHWEEAFRKDLVERLKAFKPASVKEFADELIIFNGDLTNPSWTWNDSAIEDKYIWSLRDTVTILENRLQIKKTS